MHLPKSHQINKADWLQFDNFAVKGLIAAFVLLFPFMPWWWSGVRGAEIASETVHVRKTTLERSHSNPQENWDAQRISKVS